MFSDLFTDNLFMDLTKDIFAKAACEKDDIDAFIPIPIKNVTFIPNLIGYKCTL